MARVGAGPVGRGRADGSSAAPSELAVASHPRPHTELSGHMGTFDAVVPCPRTRLFCLSVQILGEKRLTRSSVKPPLVPR